MNGSSFFRTVHIKLCRCSEELWLKSYLSSAFQAMHPGRDGFSVLRGKLACGLAATLFPHCFPPTHPLHAVCPWVLLILPSLFLTFHSHCYTFDQAFIPSYQYYFKTHLISFIDFIPLSPSLPHTPSSLSVSPEGSLKCKSEHAVHFLRTLRFLTIFIWLGC